MGGLGCDNMTCVLVCLLQGKPYQVRNVHSQEKNSILSKALVERCARQAAAREEERRARVDHELGLTGGEGEGGNRNQTEETEEEEETDEEGGSREEEESRSDKVDDELAGT